MAVFHVTFMAETLGRTVPLTVILPTDKLYFPGMHRRETGKPYKTLYLLHGILGSCNDWLYGTRIQRFAEERDLAVVMPSGDNSFYLDTPVDRYGEFIGRELVDFTRRSFPLSHKRSETFIGGLSMGGFGALRNGLLYRETFGAIVALSSALVLDESTLNPPARPVFRFETAEYYHQVFGTDLAAAIHSDRNPPHLAERLADDGAEFPAIYLACGDQDSLLPQNQAFHELLERLGVSHIFEVGPGSHEWDFWDTYIRKALDWLPLERTTAGQNSGNVM